MPKLGLVSLLVIAGCSGGGSSAPVDPASLDACLAWANGVCRMAYLCVDTAAQDSAFHARYGSSSDTCWDVLSKRCESNQPTGSAFGPSCGPGKTVNQAALTACENNLQSELCADWTAAPAGGCENICGGTSSSPDAGTKLDTGAGATGSVATAADFCATSGSLICDRAFECDATNAAAIFGDLASCKSGIAAACAGSGTSYCPNGYTASLAPTCLTDMRAAACTVVSGSGSLFDSVPSCGNACKQ